LADRIREFALELVVGMIAAAIAAIVGLATGTAWLGVLIFLALAAVLLLFVHLTRDRIPISHLPGLEVYWLPRGGRARKVKVSRVESGEPEYAIVDLEGHATTAWVSELSLTLSQRLKYSWRRG
jgi:hypothetical protein